MGKSEWRNMMATELYKDAHTKGMPPRVKVDATVVVFEGIQMLKSLQGKKLKTCVDLVQAFRATIYASLGPGSKVEDFIMLFDKYPWVPVSKGVEQEARDKQPSAAADADDVAAEANGPAFPGAKELAIGSDLDENWQAHLHDRHWHIPRYIRFIVTHLLVGPPMVALRVRPGVRVVFDGHYIEDLDAIPEIDLPERVQKFPFVLQRLPIQLCDGQVSLREDLENTIGEGDFAIPFFLTKVAPDRPAIVYSIDSDLVWILLRFLDRFPDHPGIALFFWPHLSFAVAGTYPSGQPKPAGPGPWQRWFDMKRLRDLILADPQLQATGNPLRALEFACQASGGDYVPYLHIPPKHWVTALRKDPGKFKDLTADTLKQFGAFTKLVAKAMTTAQLTKMPSSALLENTFLNLRHYLSMMDQIGKAEGTLIEDNPMLWGYERIDRTQDLTRTNIKRSEENMMRDMCRLLPEHDRTVYGLWPSYPPLGSERSREVESAVRLGHGASASAGAPDDESDDESDASATDYVESSSDSEDAVMGDDRWHAGSSSSSSDGEFNPHEIAEDPSGDERVLELYSDEDEVSGLHTAFGVASVGEYADRLDGDSLLLSVTFRNKIFGTTLYVSPDWPAAGAAELLPRAQNKLKRLLSDLEQEETLAQQEAPLKRGRKK